MSWLFAIVVLLLLVFHSGFRKFCGALLMLSIGLIVLSRLT